MCIRDSNKIYAIHRGFSTYEKSIYRNKPKWDIPIELKRKFPEIPMICDPSHICGSKDLIPKISQSAYDLNFDGLMIESHPSPKDALSDADQQLTPNDLCKLLDSLVYRKVKLNPEGKNILEVYREQIDAFDNELIEIFFQRMNVVEEIAKYKKNNNVTIYQPNRWDSILKSRIENGFSKGYKIETIEDLDFFEKEEFPN